LSYGRGLTGKAVGFRVGEKLDHTLVVVFQHDTGEVIREIPVKQPFISAAVLDAIKPGSVIHAIA
jgi:uncharacterized FlaG/YvyC family protein